VLAGAYLQAGRLFEAQGVYRQLSEVAPGDARAWLGLAVTQQQLRRFSEAHVSYNHALQYARPGWPAIGFIEKQLDEFVI
jgi:Flp pilus assembly protein TadD